MLKRYPIVFLLILSVLRSNSQDLKQDWAKIQSEFLSGMHDSVVTHIRPFITNLEKQNLKPQLSVALFHYGVSLAQTGNVPAADSAFERARSVAQEAGLKDKVTEIDQKQAQLYVGLGKGMERTDPPRAVQYYSKALTLISASGSADALPPVYYQRGLLLRSMGDTARAAADFESGLHGTQPGDQLRQSFVTLLTELYLKTGQDAKAKELTSGSSTGKVRVEYVIKLAADAEGAGDTKKAEDLLASVEREVFAQNDDARAFEYVKKRYSLAEKRGLRASHDTLDAILRRSRAASPALQFRLHNFMGLALVQAGDVSGAGEQVRILERLASSESLPADFRSHLARIRGDVAYLQGDHLAAIAAYAEALQSESAFDVETLLSMSNNLGLALSKSGKDEDALAEFDRMAAKADRLSMPSYRIQADLNSGIVLIKMDRIKEATERLTRAKELADERGDVTLGIMASLRLAEGYRRDGYEQLSDQMFENVRRDQDRLANPMNRIQVLQALAENAKIRGNKYMALLNLRQAYDLTVQIGALGFQGALTIDLADTYFLVDSLAMAKRMYKRALEIYAGSDETGVVVEQHYKLGQCYLTESQFDSARAEIVRGLSRLVTQKTTQYASVPLESVREPDLFGQGLANLGFIGMIEGRRKNDIRRLLSSLEEVRRSVEILERKKGLGISQTQKESEQLRNVNAYRLLVDVSSVLYELTRDPQYFELAFNTSEKSRAEAFVTDVGAQLIAKINDPNVKQLSEVAAKIVEERTQEQGPASVDLTSGQQSRGLSVKGGRTDEKTLALYERIVRDLASKNNKAAQLVSVNTMNLRSVQNVLSPNDALLSYYMSIDKLYLFLVSKEQTSLRSIQWSPEEVAGKVEAFRSAVHDLKRNDFQLLGRELYDSLISPAQREMDGKRIIIVPSGRLNNLPFACLLHGDKYLAEEFDMTVLPNVSTLQFVRTERKLPASPKVIALGNPMNPRVTRLPGTEREVGKVKEIYPGSQILLADQASETNCRNQMGGFDIIHIACHGLFNDNYPLLSSLVLSPDSRNDGFLEVHELYNLNLTNVSLVILSACETGLSLIKRNDDVIGLVRGFLYAGVPSMVASLWKVDDDATAALMSNFHLLLKLGNSKEEALRKAQLQLLHDDRTRHPYFWAAFVLYGSPE